MLTIVILDDEPAAAELLREMTEENLTGHTLRVECFSGRRELEEALDRGLRPDIALLDIVLPEREDGIALAKALFPGDGGTQVIFVTGFPAYRDEVYETEHVWFLQKPVEAGPLERALGRAMDRLDRIRNASLSVRNGALVRRIPMEEIRWVEGKGRKLILHCVREDLEYYDSLNELEKRLPTTFLRCHRSCVVNMDRVARMEAGRFTMEDGREIPISQLRRTAVRAAFLEYMRRQM